MVVLMQPLYGCVRISEKLDAEDETESRKQRNSLQLWHAVSL